MKKKKLKKRIKKLEEKCKAVEVVAKEFVNTFKAHREMIGNLGEKYTELRKDFNSFNQRYNADLVVLKNRTDVDYTQFSKLTPSCETCKYKGLKDFEPKEDSDEEKRNGGIYK